MFGVNGRAELREKSRHIPCIEMNVVQLLRFDILCKENDMRYLSRIVRKIRERRGQSLVEYALILALVAIVVITGLTSLGNATGNTMDNVSTTLAGTAGSGGESGSTGTTEPVLEEEQDD